MGDGVAAFAIDGIVAIEQIDAEIALPINSLHANAMESLANHGILRTGTVDPNRCERHTADAEKA